MTERFFTDGDAYEKFMGRWSRVAGETFLDWLALPAGLNWLDVGCGTGAFTELVLERCAPKQISGIDPSEDQIGYARKRPNTSRAAFRSGDAQSLPYASGEFDVAAMALVISFIPNPPKAAAEMRRVVKSGGTICAYMWDFFGKGFTQRPLIEGLSAAVGVQVEEIPGRVHSTTAAMQSIFEAAGAVQVTTRAIDIEVSYPDFEEYWTSQTRLLNPAVQAIRKLSEPDIEKLKSYLRDNLPRRDGRIAYPARANAVKGIVP